MFSKFFDNSVEKVNISILFALCYTERRKQVKEGGVAPRHIGT
jgi:hypothetical protein